MIHHNERDAFNAGAEAMRALIADSIRTAG